MANHQNLMGGHLNNNPNLLELVRTFFNIDDEQDLDSNPYFSYNIECEYVDEAEYANKFRDCNKFKILSLNVQSIHAKFSELLLFISALDENCCPDIICLQETWQIRNAEAIRLPGFQNLIFRSRSNMQGGGVGFYIKEGLNITVLNNLSVFHERVFESLFIKVNICNKEYIIGNIYRPNMPFGQFTSNDLTAMFNEHLTEILSNETLKKDNVFIFGDFNIDLLKLNCHKPTSDYMESLFSLGYLQIVTKPTRSIHGSSTLIDHVLTNSCQPQFNCSVLLNRISDHFPIVCTIETSKVKPKSPSVTHRNFSKVNVDIFKANLNNVSWNPLFEMTDTQAAYSSFHNDFFTLFDLHFPVVVSKFNRNIHKKEQWMTTGLLVSRLVKIKLCKLSIKVPSNENIDKYKRYRNLYNLLLRKSKKLFYDQQFESNKSNLKKTWSLLYDVIKKTKKNNISIETLFVNGTQISDPSKIVNTFNDHFATVTDRIVQEIVPTDRPPDQDVRLCNNMLNSSAVPVSPSEIIDTIADLKPKSSSDLYGLSSKFIKNISFTVARPLAHIF
jgi:exonuclease III